jgi:uncharacterized protein (DUF427 family)
MRPAARQAGSPRNIRSRRSVAGPNAEDLAMKEPGPDHPITLTPATGQVRVRIQDHVIGASDRALVLKEADYPPVFYIPREDVESAFLSTRCSSTAR